MAGSPAVRIYDSVAQGRSGRVNHPAAMAATESNSCSAPASLDRRTAQRCPQMTGRVSPPGTPALGANEQLARLRAMATHICHGAQQTDVGGREGVGFTQLAHGDVLRGPLP